MELTEQQYRDKKQEVISKFRKEFFEGVYLYDPLLSAIVELLIRGADPYSIIESLINNKIQSDKKLKEVIENYTPPKMDILYGN